MLVRLRCATTLVPFRRRRTHRRKIFPFFSLPREVRDLVYELLRNPSNPAMFILRSRQDPGTYVLRRDRNGMPLHAFHISRQFMSELSTAFYRTALFVAVEFTKTCRPPLYMPHYLPHTSFIASTPALCRLRHLVLVLRITRADGWKDMLQQCAPLLALVPYMRVLRWFYFCIADHDHLTDEVTEYLDDTLTGWRRAQEDNIAVFAAKMTDMLSRRGCVTGGPKRMDNRSWQLTLSFEASHESPGCRPPGHVLAESDSVCAWEALAMDIRAGLDVEKVPTVIKGVEPYVKRGRGTRKFIIFPEDLWCNEKIKKKWWQFWRSP